MDERKIVTNGDIVKAMFPEIEIKFYSNLSGIKTVDINFKDNTLNGCYSWHTFSHEWWNAPYRSTPREKVN